MTLIVATYIGDKAYILSDTRAVRGGVIWDGVNKVHAVQVKCGDKEEVMHVGIAGTLNIIPAIVQTVKDAAIPEGLSAEESVTYTMQKMMTSDAINAYEDPNCYDLVVGFRGKLFIGSRGMALPVKQFQVEGSGGTKALAIMRYRTKIEGKRVSLPFMNDVFNVVSGICPYCNDDMQITVVD